MIEPENAVDIARELIRVDSQNPTSNEERVASYITDLLSKWKIPYRIQEVSAGRPNVIATVEGRERGANTVFLAHMDTVPVGEGWTKDPFGAEIDTNGVLFGRGAADMKGGLASTLWAMKKVHEISLAGKKPRNDVVLCATVDEEGPDDYPEEIERPF